MEALNDVVALGQGPVHRRVVDVGVAVREGAARRRSERLDAVRLDAGPVQPAAARGGARDAPVLPRPGVGVLPVVAARARPAHARLGRDDRAHRDGRSSARRSTVARRSRIARSSRPSRASPTSAASPARRSRSRGCAQQSAVTAPIVGATKRRAHRRRGRLRRHPSRATELEPLEAAYTPREPEGF